MLDFSPPAPTGLTPSTSASNMFSLLNMGERSSAFILANPQLAALHTMTEMKQNAILQYQNQTGIKPPVLQPQPISPPSSSSSPSASASATSNPHGIDNILNRPCGVFPSGLPRLSLASNNYLNPTLSKSASLSELAARPATAIYWPGLQHMLSNPVGWRDRISNSNASDYCKYTRFLKIYLTFHTLYL